MTPVRVRFAPSPTGYLHIGGLRTALYNYLLAKKTGGTFILRIEDTDRTRFVDDAEADLMGSMRWAGIEADQGPIQGGSVGPYRQSERGALYEEAARTLLDSGNAYYAFDTPEAIDSMKERLKTPSNPAPRYDHATRMSMRNSLSLPPQEVDALLASGMECVVRLKVDPGSTVAFDDVVRGRVEFSSDVVDDQILVKSDGMPTYHLANIVDDHHMGITHVIRGEEWLSSTPKHVLLYQAMGWEMPVMAHLPLILSPTGGKLSKRAADRQGIPVLVREYVSAGYEPEALVNYLALLGWNPGTDQELFDLEGLTQAFSLERVGNAGVQFDLDKLAWFNGQHVRRKPVRELAERMAPEIEAMGYEASPAYLESVAGLLHERIVFVHDLARTATYFFADPGEYDPDGVKKRWKEDSADLLAAYAQLIESRTPTGADDYEALLRELAETREAGAGRIIHPVRLAVSGVTIGPGLFEMLELLGPEVVARRLRTAAQRLG